MSPPFDPEPLKLIEQVPEYWESTVLTPNESLETRYKDFEGQSASSLPHTAPVPTGDLANGTRKKRTTFTYMTYSHTQIGRCLYSFRDP